MRRLIAERIYLIAAAAWRRRYLAAVPIMLMPVIGLAVGLAVPKRYEVKTTILIQEAAKLNPFLQDFTVSTRLSERMDALNALLHSRHVLGGVVAELRLVPPEATQQEHEERIQQLSGALVARLIGKDVIEIRYRSDEPQHMAKLLEKASERLLDRVVAPERSSISSSQSFLESQLEQRRLDIEASEEQIARYKATFAPELPEVYSGNVSQLSQLSRVIAERQTELDGASAALANAQRRLAQTNPVIGRLEDQIVQLRGELALLRAQYTEDHTATRGAVRRLARLEEERAAALAATTSLDPKNLDLLWNRATTQRGDEHGAQPLLVTQLGQLQALESRIAALSQEIASLERQQRDFSEKVAAYGDHERRLGEMNRDLAAKRKVFQSLAERFEMARLTGALGAFEQVERIKIIDPPRPPSGPSNLPAPLFVAAGIVAGVGLGTTLAFIAELVDLSIRTRRQLEEVAGVPVLARIPILPNDGFVQDGIDVDLLKRLASA